MAHDEHCELSRALGLIHQVLSMGWTPHRVVDHLVWARMFAKATVPYRQLRFWSNRVNELMASLEDSRLRDCWDEFIQLSLLVRKRGLKAEPEDLYEAVQVLYAVSGLLCHATDRSGSGLPVSPAELPVEPRPYLLALCGLGPASDWSREGIIDSAQISLLRCLKKLEVVRMK